MCTGAEIGLILAAAGAATNTANQYAASKKQDSLAARGIREQAELQRQASGRAMEHIDQFARSGPEGEQAQSLEAYMNALRSAQPATEGSLQPVAAANPRFAEDVGQGRALVGQEAGARAGRMSAIDAPMLQRLRESGMFNRASGDIGELQRQSGAQDFLTRLRVSQAQPNPWVGAAGTIMQGVGGAMAMAPPAGGAPGFNAVTGSSAGVPASTWNQLARVPFGGR